MSRYVNEQKIKQRSLLEPQTRLLGANIIKPPPLAVVILLRVYSPAVCAIALPTWTRAGRSNLSPNL